MGDGVKIIYLSQLPTWRSAHRLANLRVVVTNGCFDVLHLGHVTYLGQARALGDLLLVGINGDDGVRQLKGEGRPINPAADRAGVLAALASVDFVCVFPQKTALHFLTLAEPDVYVKGGDYTLETINQDERRAVESGGGKVVILPIVPGRSTSEILAKISRG